MVYYSKVKKIPFKYSISLISLGFFVTFIIDPRIVDPINSPKMWTLIVFSAWLVPYLIFKVVYQSNSISKIQKTYILLSGIFVILLFISALKSEMHYRAFFGEVQRRNGFLTYLCLVIVSLVVSTLIQEIQIRKFYQLIGIGTLILSLYGLAQSFNLDLISWNNPYNPVIGTLGNPNFMGATLAILCCLCLSGIFVKTLSKSEKAIITLITFVSFIVIILSNALQGIVSLSVGVIFIICGISYSKNKRLGISISLLSLAVFCIAIFGMLQKGPLSDYLYKDSVTLRGYYWKTGLEMLKHNPIFGVGLDNYGSYFNEYRDLAYPLKFGFTVTSNNAHNVPIQLFATSGIFTGIIYLLIICFVLQIGLKTIVKVDDENLKIFFLGLVASYLVFQAQSIVSIDNVGVSIWGWIIAGLIVVSSTRILELDKSSIGIGQHGNKIKNLAGVNVVSYLCLICAVITVAYLYQGEKNAFKASQLFLAADKSISVNEINFTKEQLSTKLMEPFYKFSIAVNLGRTGDYTEPIRIVSKLLDSDPRNLYYLEGRASFYEFSKQYKKAVNDRQRIIRLNPGNGNNYYQLMKDYIAIDDYQNAQKILDRLNSFASKTDIAIQATTEMKNVQKEL